MQWNPDTLKAMSWRKFEEFCAAYLQIKGLITQVSPPANDQGVDIILYKEGFEGVYSIAQCKRYTDNYIDVSEISKFLGSIVIKNIKSGYFLTTSQFSERAKQFVGNLKDYKIILIDGNSLSNQLNKLDNNQQMPLISLLQSSISEPDVPICEICGSSMVKRPNVNGNGYFWGCASYATTGCRFKISTL